MLTGRNANCAHWLAPQLSQCCEFRFDLLEARRDRLQQPDPGFGWRDAPCGACRSRSLSRSSRPLIVWLKADCETPNLAPALVKLRSFATMAKAARSLKFMRGID